MTPDILREFGNKRGQCRYRIREELEKRGWTLNSLARDMGISGVAISKVVTGKSHSPRILERLRQAGVPEKYLFDPRKTDKEKRKVA